MRDRRFIAAHRGGLLSLEHHRQLARWAAACAKHLLPLFYACSDDPRPRQAIDTARAWSHGEVPVGTAQKAAVAAHAAARDLLAETGAEAAVAVARAAGHAAATAHMADHCLGPVIYGRKALTHYGSNTTEVEAERTWQLTQVPDALRDMVVAGLAHRVAKR